jgi:hypothetical protein
MDKFRVLGLAMGEWIVLTGASTLAGAEITFAAWTARGWTVRIVECAA